VEIRRGKGNGQPFDCSQPKKKKEEREGGPLFHWHNKTERGDRTKLTPQSGERKWGASSLEIRKKKTLSKG